MKIRYGAGKLTVSFSEVLFRINLLSKLPNSTYMELTYIVMSFYLCCVFFSFETHRKLVNGANFELFIHFPCSCCQYCNRQFYINILSFRLIVSIWITLAAFPRRRSERIRLVSVGYIQAFPVDFLRF